MIATNQPNYNFPFPERDDSILIALGMDQAARDRAYEVFLEHERQMQELRDRGLSFQ